MSQATNWPEPAFGRQAKREYDKALRSRGGLAAGLALLSCRSPVMKGAGSGISFISLSTKPNRGTHGGGDFNPLACICKTRTYAYMNVYARVRFNVTANLEYERYFKLGIVLSFMYETGLLKVAEERGP